MENCLEGYNRHRSIIWINTFLYRVDAFLNTLYDLTVVLIGVMLFLGKMYINTSFEQLLAYFLLIPLLTHFLYAIVYGVNDYIDYEKVIHYSSEKFVYYIYRPIIFFNRSPIILISLNSLYIFFGFALIGFLKLPAIIYAPLVPFFAITSLLRSKCTNVTLKYTLFSLLRLTKYSYAAVTLELLLLQGFHLYPFFVMFTAFLVPYTIFRTVEYMVLSKDLLFNDVKVLKGKIRGIVLIIIGVILSSFSFSYYHEYNFNTIERILIAYATCSLPVIGLYFLLSPHIIKKLSKSSSSDGYRVLLLKRLVDALLTFLFALLIVYILITV